MATDVTLASNRIQISIGGVLKSSITYENIVRMAYVIKQTKSNTGTSEAQMLTRIMTTSDQWILELHLRGDGPPEQILLGLVDDQITWTNDAAGYSAAENDIYSAFP